MSRQLILEIWNKAIGGAYYDTLIRSARELENTVLDLKEYYDEE